MKEKSITITISEEGAVETRIRNLTGEECANGIVSLLISFANILRGKEVSERDIRLTLRGMAEYAIENKDESILDKESSIIN